MVKRYSKEWKEKISNTLKGHKAWNKGIKTGPVSEETKKKLSIIKQKNPTKYWLGKNFSKEHKEKLSEKKKGIKTKNKIVIHHKNGNHFDNRLENRQAMTNSKHTTLHWDQGDIRNGRVKLNMEVT